VRDRTPDYWDSCRDLVDADQEHRGRLTCWPVVHYSEERVAKHYDAAPGNEDWESPRGNLGWRPDATAELIDQARKKDRKWWSSASLDEQVHMLEELLLRANLVEHKPPMPVPKPSRVRRGNYVGAGYASHVSLDTSRWRKLEAKLHGRALFADGPPPWYRERARADAEHADRLRRAAEAGDAKVVELRMKRDELPAAA
jgi:hypothetical protein